MKLEDTRRSLIEGTIYVIANEGLDKATTKQIGTRTGINEAYIYRCFDSKEDMFAKAFELLDCELVDIIMSNIDVMYLTELDYETRCRLFFFKVWNFITKYRERCLAYVSYYYSPYFRRYSAVEHKKRYGCVVEKFKDSFIEEADVWMILNHILNVMLDFAIKVYNDEMPNEDNYSEHIFRVIYRSVEQYFKKR